MVQFKGLCPSSVLEEIKNSWSPHSTHPPQEVPSPASFLKKSFFGPVIGINNLNTSSYYFSICEQPLCPLLKSLHSCHYPLETGNISQVRSERFTHDSLRALANHADSPAPLYSVSPNPGRGSGNLHAYPISWVIVMHWNFRSSSYMEAYSLPSDHRLQHRVCTEESRGSF